MTLHEPLRILTRVGTIVALAALVFFITLRTAEAATLKLSPDTGVYAVGSTFSARVVVNTQGKPINAAEAALRFNPNELSVISIAKGSIFNLWTVEPTFSNSTGIISFGGGSPSGYTGGAGTIMSVTFRSKVASPSKVTFSSGSVLAADGLGTNVLLSMNGGTYTSTASSDNPQAEVVEYVAPANTPGAPVITSTTHPDSEGWSNNTTAELRWSLPAGITAVRTLLSDSANAIPSKVYDPSISSITLPDLEEGEQYFHLQFQNDDGWGRVATYRLAVDTERPENLTVSLAPEQDTSAPEQLLVVTVEDVGSAVKRYIIKINDDEPFEYIDEEMTGVISLPSLPPGYHTLTLEAFDEAGNSAVTLFAFTIEAFAKPLFTEYPTRLNDGVIPVLKGATKGNASVLVSVTKVSGGKANADNLSTYEVMSNANGEFIVILDDALTAGVYEITAIATDENGAKSESSDPIRIIVEVPGYLQFGAFAVSVLSVIIPLAALVVISVLGFLYVYRRFLRVRTAVVRETDEALDVLEREFATLQASLTEQAAAVAATRKSNALTKAEEVLVGDIASKLEAAERKLKKEIADVDDVVTK